MPKKRIERQVRRSSFTSIEKQNNMEFDDTYAMDIGVIRTKIEDCCEYGVPDILHLTFKYKSFEYLSLDIPILPINYDLDTPNDVEDFLIYGSEDDAKVLVSDLSKQEKEKKIDAYTQRIMNYICHELAKVYEKQKESALANAPILSTIQNLNIMQRFDLNPGGKSDERGIGTSIPRVIDYDLPIIRDKKQRVSCYIGLVEKDGEDRVKTSPDYDDYDYVHFANILKYLNSQMWRYEEYPPKFRGFGS